LAGQHFGALVHARQARGISGRQGFGGVKPGTAVLDLETESIFMFPKAHGYLFDSGMARNVRKRFLDDAECGGFDLRREPFLQGSVPEVHVDAGLLFVSFEMPFQGRQQAQVIEYLRPQAD
jgi:hypothetical protein